MERSALVIGGTGPTGPSLVNGLLAQGFKTAILHTGGTRSTPFLLRLNTSIPIHSRLMNWLRHSMSRSNLPVIQRHWQHRLVHS